MNDNSKRWSVSYRKIDLTVVYLANLINILIGIFVGFGALINVTRRDETGKFKLWQIRALVTAGLGVIVVALLPIGNSHFGITGHNLWFSCGLIYLILNWFFHILVIRKPEIKKVLTTQVKGSPKMINSL